MSTSLRQLSSLLQADGLRFGVDHERQVLYFGVVEDDAAAPHALVLHLQEKGEFLRSQLHGLATLESQDPDIQPKMQALLRWNRELKMLGLAWDPTDGEVFAKVDLVLEDAALTARQFRRAMGALLMAKALVERGFERIEQGKAAPSALEVHGGDLLNLLAQLAQLAQRA